MPAGRLAELLKARPGKPRSAGPAPGRRTPMSAGRHPLLTQAIMLLLHHPSAARAVAKPPDFLKGDHKGFAVLVELLEMAKAEPELTTAQLIERWRERPEGARLAELAAEESLVRDGRAAGRDLVMALKRLAAEFGPDKRLNELIAMSRERKLTLEEQQEFQQLLGDRGGTAGV
jgi:DNA primase